MKHKIFYYLIFGILATSCNIDPLPIQDQTTEELWSHAQYGEGILTNAYVNLNASYPISMDYFTDNAVPNTPGSNALALGTWGVENSSIGNWELNYNMIKYLNLYIENGEDLIFAVLDKEKDSILKSRRIGEAYFLRAWYQADLLKTYGGVAEGGTEFLGFPIVTTFLEQGDDLDLPRNTYEECVLQIAADCDKAIELLPLAFNQEDLLTNITNRGRASRLAALALKSRVLLNAASPAYSSSTQEQWERAAVAAHTAIDSIVSVNSIDLAPYNNFNDADSFDNIWIQPEFSGNSWESAFYPPSLYGSGICNPSQNLVDVFPTADGYPIETSSTFDDAMPYDNRDERFYRFIFYNGDDYNGTTIETYIGGDDAPGGLTQQGTRTGYYMKKLLSKNVSLSPNNTNTDNKFYVFLGKTELYLNFAEAANEAYGPTGSDLGLSALDIMAKIRERAGIDSDPATAGYQDQYMQDQASAGKEAFREFIKNERRLELCFEGFRFWDIRRWEEPLNHDIEGVKITQDLVNGDSYNYVTVESHTFQDYMKYAPLPYDQTLIMSNLKQNAGW